MRYEPRTYRSYSKSEDLISFKAQIEETDLFILADRDLSAESKRFIERIRADIKGYIQKNPGFKDSLEPVEAEDDAPRIIRDMVQAAKKAGVGPMAAVAGAVAEAVGRELLKFSSQVIVENGGDIFISSDKPRIIGIYAGESKLSEKIGIQIEKSQYPCGICTSSGTVGHSLSFGKADAVVIISTSTALADAAATAICNKIKSKDDIGNGIEFAQTIEGVSGILVIVEDIFGAWGDVKLVDI
ncbi:UPF0280 family protein [Candidatus Omnitrophota bacterium]